MIPAITEDGRGSRCVIQCGERSRTEPKEGRTNIPIRIVQRPATAAC
jgi:hypothetical protein